MACAPTITERMPPAKRTPPATMKKRAMCTREPRSGGAQGVDGRNNVRRSGAPGPHAHGNVARHVVDDQRAEVRGQRKPSNDPRNNQHNPWYANHWDSLTHKLHPPQPARLRGTND